MSNYHNWQKDIDRVGIDKSKIGKQLAEQFRKNLPMPTAASRTTDSNLSTTTQSSKSRALVNLVAELSERKENPVRSLWAIEPEDVEYMCAKWREAGNTTGGIENKLSHFRTLAKWIGKRKLVLPTEKIMALHGMEKRSGVATKDKSWSGNNVDIGKLIEKAFIYEPCVGVQLLLQLHFGLRATESFLLKPEDGFKAIEEMLWLRVTDGTKGKRKRITPVYSQTQKNALEFAGDYANGRTGSTIPDQYNLEQWKNRYYFICKKIGLTIKDAGVTSHGLRHEALQNLYKFASGDDSPIKLLNALINDDEPTPKREPKTDVQKLAETIVAEAAGHSKVQKAHAYIGSLSVRAVPESKMEDVTDEAIKDAIKNIPRRKVDVAAALGISRSYLYKRMELIEKKELALAKIVKTQWVMA